MKATNEHPRRTNKLNSETQTTTIVTIVTTIVVIEETGLGFVKGKGVKYIVTAELMRCWADNAIYR